MLEHRRVLARLAAALLLLLLQLLPLAGCAAEPAPPAAPEGSVALGASREFEPLLDAHPQAVVALVLPPAAPGRPERVALAARAAATRDAVLQVLADVESYPRTVPQVIDVEVKERGAGFVRFEAEIDLPFQNLRYGLRYDFSHGRVDVLGESGATRGGRWSWEVLPLGTGAIIVHTSESRLGDGKGFFLEQLLDFHPDLEQGLSFAQGLRFLNAIRQAAEARARASPGPGA